jgi:DNA repair protein RadA/Sms
MSLFTAEGAVHIPAVAREVFDVSGAGDTVIATLAALVAAGAPLADAMAIANQAAGVVVGKLGTGGRAILPSSIRPSLAKPKTVYACTECGGQSPKWQGQCPGCGAWNTLVESIAAPAPDALPDGRGRALDRAPASLDRRAGSAARATGSRRVRPRARRRPGARRRRAARRRSRHRQVDAAPAGRGALGASRKVIYVTGEESAEQIALRAERLGPGQRAGRDPRRGPARADRRALDTAAPEIVIVDSIQTVYTEALQSAPGSVSQVRECAAQLTRVAKQRGIVVVFVGHVTKDGAIAGPRVLEHIVDAVLYFEGDPHSAFRLVRAIKNRFGAANELGVFAMTERGLKGVSNPSALFLSQHAEPVPGSAVVATVEGLAADAGRDPGAGRPGAGE